MLILACVGFPRNVTRKIGEFRKNEGGYRGNGCTREGRQMQGITPKVRESIFVGETRPAKRGLATSRWGLAGKGGIFSFQYNM